MKILITGGSSGLGLCLAKEFLRNGDEVWGIGRRTLDIECLSKGFPGLLRYCQCDTTKIDQVKLTFEKMVKAEYIPDKIIFCAGSAVDDVVVNNFKFNEFKENFDLNLFGVMYWIELFLPYFLEREHGIFAAISSMSVYVENHRRRIGYSASRIALNKVFENLHLEYIHTGIYFKIFNMGRIQEKNGLIGLSYSRACKTIIKNLKTGKHAYSFNIPFSQYLFTRIASFIPKKLFRAYLMKHP